MTTAETIAARAHATGEAKGHAKGRAEGHAEMLIELLTHKFGPLPQTTLDTITGATTDQLRTWGNRILTATTLDDTLR